MSAIPEMVDGLMRTAEAMYALGVLTPLHITIGMNQYLALEQMLRQDMITIPVQIGMNWRGDQRITLLTPYMPIVIGGTWDVQI